MSKAVLSDLDSMTSANESVFSQKFRESAMLLLRKIARQMYLLDPAAAGSKSVKTGSASLPSSDGGFMSSVSRFLMLDGDTGSGSPGMFPHDSGSAKASSNAKAKHHFEVSIKAFAEILGIPEESVATILSREQSLVAAGDQLDGSAAVADIYETIDDGIVKLNEKGRTLLASGSLDRRMLKNFSDSNPDTQPARSYECALIIPITLMLSNIINERFGDKLQTAYNMAGPVGSCMQMLLAKPTKYVEYVRTERHAPDMIVRQLPARVCLRFLSWNIWLVLIGLYFVYCLLCFSPLYITLTVIVGGLIGALAWTLHSLM